MSTQVAVDTTYVMCKNDYGKYFWELWYKGELVLVSDRTYSEAEYRIGTDDAYKFKQQFINRKLAELRK
jgi:hypothetical protein